MTEPPESHPRPRKPAGSHPLPEGPVESEGSEGAALRPEDRAQPDHSQPQSPWAQSPGRQPDHGQQPGQAWGQQAWGQAPGPQGWGPPAGGGTPGQPYPTGQPPYGSYPAAEAGPQYGQSQPPSAPHPYGSSPGQYNPGQYNPGQYDPGQYDQGQYNPGQYNQGPYGRGDPYDQGQAPGQPGYPPQSYSTPSPAVTRPLSPADEQLWSTLSHISIPFLGLLGPLVVFLVLKDRGQFVRSQAVESLNFSILYTLAQVLCGVLTVVLVGYVLSPIVFVGALVLCILAGMANNRGEPYRYPVNWRLVR